MKQSTGILVFRQKNSHIEVLLAHPGGPFWSKKDVWSVPKGELEEKEDPESAAKREFAEELGFAPPEGKLIDLGSIKASNKVNQIWALEADVDIKKFAPHSTVTLEWPPHSGQTQEFPEIDRIAWFTLPKAQRKVYKSQIGFIERLAQELKVDLTAEKPEATTSQQSLF